MLSGVLGGAVLMAMAMLALAKGKIVTGGSAPGLVGARAQIGAGLVNPATARE